MKSEKILDSVDTLEFYVGSAKEWSYFHQYGLGFKLVGYSGPETGVRDKVSYMLKQGDIKFIFTNTLYPKSPILEHTRLHGDGVRDISMKVSDINETIEEIDRRGVVKHGPVTKIKTDNGTLFTSLANSYGETMHSLNDYGEYENDLPPGFMEVEGVEIKGTGIRKIDHIVGNVEDKNMDKWVNYYINGFGFEQLVSFDDKDISTEYSSLRSKVVHYNNRSIIFPINEPALGLKKSQIQEYIDYYNSPGVQHIAMETGDIIKTVSDMKARGIEFLSTPSVYYDTLDERVGTIREDVEKLRALDILVDRDDDGYLLQIFSKPIGDRPTVFYEIIQRRGATSFGKGNFRSLFQSIETEQAKRGNL
ncbi:MAG: 4-hydroxyphenylpyruvate dioxygenase [Thermoplasmataceae archaeon]